MHDYEAKFLTTLTPAERRAAETMNGGPQELQSGHFVLDESHTIITVGLGTWAVWFEREHRKNGGLCRVARDEWQRRRVGTIDVSTVFLGIDHGFGGRSPLLFETMVFVTRWEVPRWIDRLINKLGWHRAYTLRRWLRLNHDDRYQCRYMTWDEATQGHRWVVERTKQWLDGTITADEYYNDEPPTSARRIRLT